MTRSTSINNAELRKMSTPIPINVNTWQMRSPDQYLNLDDSNQFDSGIMEHCISQSSISPSSAASYSFSPVAYNLNQDSKSGKILNPANIGNINNSGLTNNQIQQYHNMPQVENTVTLSQNSNNNSSPFIHDLSTDVITDSNQLSSSSILNQFTYDNYTSVDLATTNDFFSEDDRNACDIIDNDFSNLNNNFYNDLGSDDVSLPVELVESLLINTTLSDHSNKNILISDDDMLHAHTKINDNLSISRNDDDSNEEQNANNNINPMFLFTNKSNKISQANQKQNGNITNNLFTIQSNTSQTTGISDLKDNKKQNKLLKSVNSHKTTNKPSFRHQNYKVQRKIEEEGEDIYNSDFQRSTDIQYDQAKSIEYAISLPVDSYLSETTYRPIYQTQTVYDSSINNINSNVSNNQISDPVLTQVQLNNKASFNIQHYDSNKPLLVSNHRVSYQNDFYTNRKINYMLNHQNESNPVHIQNLIPNNFVNIQQFSTSMSLPAPRNLNSNEWAADPHSANHIKLKFNDDINKTYFPMKYADENDESFSKLKLSSPCSSNASNSSESPVSSSSANCLHGNYQASLRNSSALDNNSYQEKSISQNIDLESINSSELFTGSLNDNDVISVLTTPPNPTSNDLKNNLYQQQNENNFFNQMKGLVENTSNISQENSSNLTIDLEIKQPNSVSIDQNVVENYLKNENDSNKDQLKIKSSNNGGKVRRRTAVSFSRNEEDCEDINNEGCDENEYEDAKDEDCIENDEIQNSNKTLSTTGAIAINRRRNSRSISGTSNKLSKSFCTPQSIPKRRQFNSLCIGSVGSTSQLYMIQQQRGQLPVNCRKQARTSTLNTSNRGVDVHSFNQPTNNTIQHLTSSNSKNMFSNIQFSPFSNNTSDEPNHKISSQNFLSNSQLAQEYLSTSLPANNNLDSMMHNINDSNLIQDKNKFAVSNNNKHPNLNKLLNISDNNKSNSLWIERNLESYQTASSKKSHDQLFSEIDSNLKPSLKKKKYQKKQEIFYDVYDSDDISDGDSVIETPIEVELKKSFKLEESDLEDDSDSDSNDSNDCLNTNRHSLNSNGILLSQSTSNSFTNNESLFDLMMSSKNRDAYFWQYNIQSKGPKTKKVLTLRNKDPHLHRDFFDPVFQLQSLNARGGTAVNKLRKGDGNDVTPNPEKLFNLGNQIKDFIQKSYQMNNICFSPPSSLMSSSSFNQLTITNKSIDILSSSVDTQTMSKEKVNLKREKNKIASRACRLKKKAQHEANKIKLFGLNEEHKQLLECISSARELIRTKLTDPQMVMSDQKMIDLLEERINHRLKTKLAGNADGYVQMLMLQVERDRSNNKKSNLDLNNFNHQYALFQQHEKRVLNQQQHLQNIKVEQKIQNTNQQCISDNKNNLSTGMNTISDELSK